MSRSKTSRRPRKRRRRPRSRKSGNHTTAKQWLYVLWNLPRFWTVKIGITGDLQKRLREVDKDNQGLDILVFAVKVYRAYQLEQAVHRLCAGIRYTGFKGTGKTERFFCLAAIPAIIGGLFHLATEIAFWIIIILLTSYLIAKIPDYASRRGQDQERRAVPVLQRDAGT